MSLFNVNKPKDFNIEMIIFDIKEIIQKTIIAFQEEGLHRGKKQKFHDRLQDELVNLADDYGFIGDKEFKIEQYEKDRNGYIDVVWKGFEGNSLLLEIDSAPRKKSVTKLLLGKATWKVWIYYGINNADEALQKDTQKEIYLIHIPISDLKEKKIL